MKKIQKINEKPVGSTKGRVTFPAPDIKPVTIGDLIKEKIEKQQVSVEEKQALQGKG